MRLTFSTAPAGLAPLVDFDFDGVDGAVGLYTLAAVDAPAVRLFLVDPALYVPGYAPKLPDASTAGAKVLVVARAQSSGTTVNLLAPIIIDEVSGDCSQLILDGSYPVDAPLLAA